MTIILAILGGLALLVIGVVAFGWILLKRVARRSFDALPSRISVVHEQAPQWKNVEERDAAFDAFKALRFESAGTFQIPELRILVAGFIREEDCLVGAVYEHPVAGVFSDVCIEYEDGSSLTVSNAPHGAEMDTMPGHKKIIVKGLNVVQLVQRADDERGAGRAKAFAPSAFPKLLSEAYARDYDWRKNRGGTTVQETLRVMDTMSREEATGLPCAKAECPYEHDRKSERDIEGMPFPPREQDARACPKFGHICPKFMEDLGLTVEDLRIRATLHCGSLADTLVSEGKMSRDSEEYQSLMARFEETKRAYPIEDYPQYYR